MTSENSKVVEQLGTCEACLGEMDRFGYIFGYRVCWECTQARHYAALRKKCACRKTQRRERMCQTASRIWVACDRCLGTVRQIA